MKNNGETVSTLHTPNADARSSRTAATRLRRFTGWLLMGALSTAGCQSFGHTQVADGTEGGSIAALSRALLPSFMSSQVRPTLPLPAVLDEELESPHLLARLAAGFAFEQQEHPRIDQEKTGYLQHIVHLGRTFERGEPYLHYILSSIEERGLPTELALIPLIESAYNPFAYSAVQAAGLWQFMPTTGLSYGLNQDFWYDGRRDVIESTQAALDYLTHLNELFAGDWLITLAAYNAGQGTVRRAIENNRSAGLPTDFWSLSLPQETRNYIPRLLAVSQILKNAESLGLNLPELDDAPSFAIVPLEGQIDLSLAAELAGVSLEDIQQLNPGFSNRATAPNGPQRLLVPIEQEELFVAGLGALDLHQQEIWGQHRISPGETLSHIAHAYGTTVETLRQINGITGNGNLIRVGDLLAVPRPSESLLAYNNGSSNGNTATPQAATQTASSNGATSALNLTALSTNGAAGVEHVVRAGESLWVIAQRYGVSVNQLASWNQMTSSDTLTVGRVLTIRQNGASSGLVPVAANAADQARIQQVRYVVRSGDSFWRIAANFGVNIEDLRRWNDLPANAVLHPGQELIVYVDPSRQSI